MQRFRQTPPPPEAVNQLLDDLDRILTEQAAAPAPPPPAAEAAPTPEPAGSDEPAESDEAAPKAAGEALPDESAIASDPMAALRELSGGGPVQAGAGNIDRLALALSDEHPRTVALVLG